MSKKTTLEGLLDFFPDVELPVTLSEDYTSTFSANNAPLPQAVIEEYILRWEESEEIDEFTEYVPCFQLPEAEHYKALVYWKGGLLKYEYILVTLDNTGLLLERKILASTLSDNFTVRKSVAQIDEDLIITIIAGETIEGTVYNPERSQSFTMEILHDGHIIFSDE